MPQDLDTIMSRLDVYSFFEAQGQKFEKKTSKGWYTDCPFCGGKQKLRVSSKGLWKCFKCDEKGNAITFYARTRNCSNGEAVKAIKQFAGIEDDNRSSMAVRLPEVNQTDVLINLSAGDAAGGEGPDEENASTANNGGEEVTARGPAQARDIYTTLVRDTALTDAHREELRSRRGFTDDLIERLSFRSGGQQITGVIDNLRTKYSDQALLDAGILVEVNGVLSYNQQLLEDRLLIPYLDEKGEVYHLRPHKLGFKGLPIHPYCRYLLQGDAAEIVLTEGEFKAAALYQWGIPALAIPGVSSFADKYFDRLMELLKEFGVKKVVVIFDNEIKDNPAFPNYKQKPEDRYDTEFWSYMMAYKLGRTGLVTRIGRLPDEWREKGKVDFDGALAAGKSREEILRVIDQAKTPTEYLQSFDEQAARVVRRKLAKQFTRVPLKREFNKYVAQRFKGGETYEETISNFVLNIKSSFFTPDGVIRSVQLVNEYGETSDIFSLAPSDMAGLNEFKKFCFGKGNYVFEGSTQDLLNVWKLEFLRDIGDLIYMPDRIGRINKNLWLFGNLAICKGKVYRPDNDGIIWIDGKGYKPQSLQIGARGESIEDAIPSLREAAVNITDIAAKLRQSVGGYEAYMGIGWMIATIFSEDIFEQYKCLPILFPHGKRESGKSTFMRWLMAFFGVENDGVGLAETSQNYIARALSYYSSLGAWFDEYRNENRVTQKDGFFRSAYNRQLSGKGTATAFQARGFAVHATAAISGEELPKDNGLFTRCVPLQISAYKRDRTWYDWLNNYKGRFSGFVFWLLTNYERLRPQIMANIAELKQALLALDVSDRTAENWAICAGAFDTVVLQDAEFIRWVGETCKEIKQAGEEEHMLNQFWGDANYMILSGEINYINFFGLYEGEGEEGHLGVYIRGLYDAWAKYYRQKTGREAFDKQSVLSYLQKEPYYVKTGVITKRLNGTPRKTHLLEISQMPEVLLDLVETIRSKERPAGPVDY